MSLLFVIRHLLRTAYLVLYGDALLYLNVYAVADARGDGDAIVSLVVARAFYDINKSGVVAELDSALRYGYDLPLFLLPYL